LERSSLEIDVINHIAQDHSALIRDALKPAHAGQAELECGELVRSELAAHADDAALEGGVPVRSALVSLATDAGCDSMCAPYVHAIASCSTLLHGALADASGDAVCAGSNPVCTNFASLDEYSINTVDNTVVTEEHMDGQAGGKQKEAEVFSSDATNTEIPSLALGPLLEKAINELKRSKGPIKKGAAEGSTVDNLVTKPVKSTTSANIQPSPLRRSLRRAASVDEDSIEKASRLVAKKNLECVEG
ncbi:hypothetical protein EJB05_40503, partial [Eragrostis curvula]